jgi:putative transposase
LGRKKRDWRPGSYYNIATRGNNRQRLFSEQEDYNFFLDILRNAHAKYQIQVVAYCLMPNHFHLLIRSDTTDLKDVMFYVKTKYSYYFRKKYQFVGHVYEKRYYSKLIESLLGVLHVSSYIHRNPSETSPPMVLAIESYIFSSFQYYRYNHLTPPPFLDMTLLPKILPAPYEATNDGYCRYCKNYQLDKTIRSKEFTSY